MKGPHSPSLEGPTMTKLMIDPDLLAKLTAPVEFTDSSGRTVGFFLTPEEHERLRQIEEEQRRLDYEYVRSVVTDEMLEEARNQTEELTYDDVLDHLRKLGEAERGGAA